MRSRPSVFFTTGGAFLLTSLFSFLLSERFHNPFPPLSVSLSTPITQLNDFAGIVLGTRRLAADIAWIQTLQYYGTPESSQTEEEFENGIGHYHEFLAHCLKVARIDPYFKYVYYYGGAALAWNLNRPAEAETLLHEGIQANPKEWRLQQYLAAIAFQKNHDPMKLAQFLESFLYEADCPNLLRSILANVYKKLGRYRDAIRVWLVVYKTNDPAYHDRSKIEINHLLGELTKGPPPARS